MKNKESKRGNIIKNRVPRVIDKIVDWLEKYLFFTLLTVLFLAIFYILFKLVKTDGEKDTDLKKHTVPSKHAPNTIYYKWY